MEELDNKVMGDAQIELPNISTKADIDTVIKSAFHDLSTWQAIKKFKHLFAMGVLASLGAMYIGYTGSAIGAIIANSGFVDQFGTVPNPKGGVSLDAQYIAIWGGVQSAATVAGVVISPFILDRLGRKALMYTLTTNVVIAIILELVAKDWKVFTAAKLFAGLGSGSLGPSVMTYMSEISLFQFRGVLLSVFSLSFALGQFINAIATQIVNLTHPNEYKRVFYSEFAIVGVWLGACLYLPESPVWLLTHGKEARAKRSFGKLIGNVSGYDLDHEFASLVSEVRKSEAVTRSYSENDWKAFCKWGNFKRSIASCLPFSAQPFSGVPYIYGYTTYFFQQAGLADPFLGNTILNVIAITSITASFFFVDRIGRRPLVLVGLAVLGVVNVAIGGLGFIKHLSSSQGAGLTALCSLWIFVYSLTLAPLGWVGTVDLSSVRLRAKTATFGTFVNASINLVFSYTVPLLLSDQDAGWGVKIGLLFGGLSFAWIIPVYFLYPETKGRTYAEIDELYTSGVSPRKFNNTETTTQLVEPGATARVEA